MAGLEIRTAETHKRYDYNSLHVRSQSSATQQWQPTLNQVAYEARRGGLNPTNQCP